MKVLCNAWLYPPPPPFPLIIQNIYTVSHGVLNVRQVLRMSVVSLAFTLTFLNEGSIFIDHILKIPHG